VYRNWIDSSEEHSDDEEEGMNDANKYNINEKNNGEAEV
jgi:hypothetical protein